MFLSLQLGEQTTRLLPHQTELVSLTAESALAVVSRKAETYREAPRQDEYNDVAHSPDPVGNRFFAG